MSDTYGSSEFVTVTYPAPEDDLDQGYHQEMLGLCVSAIQATAQKDAAPDVLRGVCHIDPGDAPLVWLIRKEWALELEQGDVFERIVDTSPVLTNPLKGGA